MARRRKAKRAARSSPRRRRRSVAARAAAPRRRARRRYRRNPFGLKLLGGAPTISYQPKALLATAIHGTIDAGAGIGGMTVARLVRGRLNLDGNTIKGAAAELGVTILTAPLVARFLGQNVARAYVQGGFMGPGITALKSLHVPIISPALGDEGELPLFGGLYDLAGTYELDQLAAGGGAPAGTRIGADQDDLAGDDAGMM